MGCCDTTLFVVAAESDEIGEVKRMLGQLERLSPPTVALLLNRVRVRGKLNGRA